MGVRLRWDRAAWDELLHFGKWLFAGNMVSSLAVQIDDLILGRLAPMASLGIYDVSAKYPFLARRAGALFAKFLVLPLLSRHHEQEPDRFREKVKEVRGIFSLVGIAPILFLFFYAPLYFGAFFPQEYRNAGWICQLLSVTVWLSHLKFSAEKVLLVLGDSKATAVANVCSLLGSGVGLLGGFALAGMTGFALGLALGPLLAYLYVRSRLAGRHGVSIVGQDLSYTGLGVGLALLGSVLPSLGLSHLDVRVRSVATFVSATIVLMVFLAVAGRFLLARISFRRAQVR
jgi:O-antigen/teichoic acid export membrane protein